jgi:hypothetical protein
VRDKCGMYGLYRPHDMVTADSVVALFAAPVVTARPECRA